MRQIGFLLVFCLATASGFLFFIPDVLAYSRNPAGLVTDDLFTLNFDPNADFCDPAQNDGFGYNLYLYFDGYGTSSQVRNQPDRNWSDVNLTLDKYNGWWPGGPMGPDSANVTKVWTEGMFTQCEVVLEGTGASTIFTVGNVPVLPEVYSPTSTAVFADLMDVTVSNIAGVGVFAVGGILAAGFVSWAFRGMISLL